MKNDYKIYSKEDVYDLLEQTNILYIADINFRNREPFEAKDYILQINYREEYYKFTVNYRGNNIKAFKMTIEGTVDFLYKYRKYYNKGV